MNIQIRDCAAIQTHALDEYEKKTGSRPANFPPAQLHPVLLEGRIDVDGTGFLVSSQHPFDKAHMERLLPKPVVASGTWRMSVQKANDSRPPIPFELVFSIEGEAGKLVARTQATADIGKLSGIHPIDQTIKYDMAVIEGSIALVRCAGQPITTVSVSNAALKVKAARLGVAWDKAASIETMAKRIQDAEKAKAKEKDLQPA